MNFFTADTHFFDQNLKYDLHFAHRHFLTVTEMNRTILTNWNKAVSEQDTVYHLGDIGLLRSKKEDYEKMYELLKELHGHLVLIKGNHDTRALFKFLGKNNYLLADKKPKFVFHDVGCILKFDHFQFFLTHYPLMLGISRNSINLHGHVHHYSVDAASNINVGVDSPEIAYLVKKIPFGTPLSSAEVVKVVKGKQVDFQKR
ncbi:metallophosphoesterase family protein [Liquorilactobacillus oeni]|uniref:Phosphoesterase n=1 Tax=Liquorilactobacillus oeni DSM 19972 TaxID=1423777 RepID=A0A0R1MFQ5_9LACO|nr:metallophosphoesterase family protein [Liquorilactobacillus oeni]KRL03986.1 phosphoesterase [Liquorilactobacillus oeni DSM 19972]